jgi:hypothetical protein
MGAARGSSSGAILAGDISYPPFPIWVCPAHSSGIAPAPGLRSPGPLSQPNVRGSPLIPVPTTYRNCQAGRSPHFPPGQRLSRTLRGHATPIEQRRNSRRARAARLPDTGRFPPPLRPGTGYAGFTARPQAGSRFPGGRGRAVPPNGRGSPPLLLGPRAGASIAEWTTSGSPPPPAPLRPACPWSGLRTGLRYWISVFDPLAVVNPQSSLAPATSPGRS